MGKRRLFEPSAKLEQLLQSLDRQDSSTGPEGDATHALRLMASVAYEGGLYSAGLAESVSRARVLPEGRGTVNSEGLDFYDRLVDGLLQRDLKPMLTLYRPAAGLRTMAPFIIAALVILWMQRGEKLTFAKEA